MRLSFKLALGFVLAMSVILFVSGVSSVRREAALIEDDIQRDHLAIGHTLASTIGEGWRSSGQAYALSLVERINRERSQINIRWTDLAARPGADHLPLLGREELAPVAAGQAVSVIKEHGGGRTHFTYVPVPVGGQIVGAIELSESLASQQNYIHTSIKRRILVTVLIAAVSALVALVLGYTTVGRPVRKLIDKARRVGSGDFSGKLELRQRDELSNLAAEMNVMSDRLAEETAARLAAMEQLRHADRLMTVGQLAAGVAHELGTPLNVVMGRGKMIVRRDLPEEEVLESAQIIVDQAERMNRIIRQLLDFARPKVLQRSRVELRPLIEKTTALLAPLAEKAHVTFRVGEADDAFSAVIDPNLLQQVLTNLVVNGLHAMPRGGELSIALRRRRLRSPAEHGGAETDCLCVEVKDQGEGIPPEVIGRVFEPFFTTKEVGEGTGLGLSVSYGIVREHGGWVAVESDAGKGTSFTICIPDGGGT